MVITIRALDYVHRCHTYEEGGIIYRKIIDALKSGEDVELSFEGVLSAPSAFINSALIQLLDDFSFDDLKQKLKIVSSTRQLNELIKQRFEFAVSRGSSDAAFD